MKSELVTVTPQLAEQWLELSGPNRPVHQPTVERLASDMRNGDWVANGDRIRFDASGALRDGRHRLAAVVLSGKSVVLEVIHGLSERAVQTVDTGRNRSFSDALFIEDLPNARAVAAVAKWIWRYENDLMVGVSRAPSHAELREAMENHPGIGDAVREVQRSKEFSSRSAIAFVYTIGKEGKPRKASEWLMSMQSGENLSRTDPVWHIRRRLTSREAVLKPLRPIELAAIVAKSWNAYAANETMTSLSWTEKEGFPTIR